MYAAQWVHESALRIFLHVSQTYGEPREWESLALLAGSRDLYWYTSETKITVVKLLLDKGADPNFEYSANDHLDPRMRMPLSRAAVSLELVKVLVEGGA